MPTKDAIRVAQRRANARAAGLCITCCKEKPKAALKVCESCKSRSLDRTRQRRSVLKQRAEMQHIVVQHERVGDSVQAHHLYDEAAKHYLEALNAAAVAPNDRFRISEKLAKALYHGNNPTEAMRWLDTVLLHYDGHPEHGAKLAELLLERAHQRWAKLNFAEALPDTKRAMAIAKEIGSESLYKRANIGVIAAVRNMAVLGDLSKLGEIETCLREIEPVTDRDAPRIRNTYYCQKAFLDSDKGLTESAYAYFEQAVRAAQEEGDSDSIITTWLDYGAVSLEFGDTQQAKTTIERALFVARSGNILWRIPVACAMYAELLRKIGQYEAARQYIEEAFAYDGFTPRIEFTRAVVGVQVALATNDRAMLSRCADPKILEEALAKEPWRCAAVFSEFYASQGDIGRAEKMLSDTLAKISDSLNSHEDFWLQFGRYGKYSEIQRARKILKTILKKTDLKVVKATMFLFDAYVAQREGRSEIVQRCALEASKRFEEFQWHAYADMARELIPGHEKGKLSKPRAHKPFREMQSLLSPREREVAELVLKGSTNKVISQQLSMSQKTVETHMGSILSKLGIQSRYQISEALPGS